MAEETIVFTKDELVSTIDACRRLAVRLTDDDTPERMGFRQTERILDCLSAYQCLFAYLYAEVYDYGNVTDVISPRSPVFAKYTLTASLVLSEPQPCRAFMAKARNSWKDIEPQLQTSTDDVAAISKAIASLSAISPEQLQCHPQPNC